MDLSDRNSKSGTHVSISENRKNEYTNPGRPQLWQIATLGQSLAKCPGRLQFLHRLSPLAKNHSTVNVDKENVISNFRP